MHARDRFRDIPGPTPESVGVVANPLRVLLPTERGIPINPLGPMGETWDGEIALARVKAQDRQKPRAEFDDVIDEAQGGVPYSVTTGSKGKDSRGTSYGPMWLMAGLLVIFLIFLKVIF